VGQYTTSRCIIFVQHSRSFQRNEHSGPANMESPEPLHGAHDGCCCCKMCHAPCMLHHICFSNLLHNMTYVTLVSTQRTRAPGIFLVLSGLVRVEVLRGGARRRTLLAWGGPWASSAACWAGSCLEWGWWQHTARCGSGGSSMLIWHLGRRQGRRGCEWS